MTVEQWLGKDNIIGQDIWRKKYQKNGETFDEWLDRVSNGNVAIRKLIIEKKFIPGGRILSNLNVDNDKAGLSNCFSRGYVEDDYDDIMKAAVDIGKTFKGEGGQGLSLSKLRPKGCPIGHVDGYVSDGIVPFMKIYNEVTEGTSQGGSRKGALLMSLDVWHKEIMDFITIKSDLNLIQKANLSVEINDEFMEIVEKDLKMNSTTVVHCVRHYGPNDEHIVEYDITPVEVFKKMAEIVWNFGEPGVLYVDRFRNYNIMEFCDNYKIETCNPCGEQPLEKHGACNLSSINLSEFVLNPYTEKAEFDYESFYSAVAHGIDYLDSVIDKAWHKYPLKEQQEEARKFRNCGLGVLGYATMLMKMGLKYGTVEADNLTGGIFYSMFRHAVKESSKLAVNHGSFPGYSEKVWESAIIKDHFSYSEIEELKKQGLRNCSVLSIAPTGLIYGSV